MLDQSLLRNATNEAIYWWQRDEYFYHKIFSNIEEIVKESTQIEFFTDYLFKTFARQYSVHRTLKDFNNNALNILEFLNSENFFNLVLKNQTNIIDKTANKMKGSLANGKPVSFLSKMAFLINPKDFSLYDKYARNSMNLILKSKVSGKKKAIDKTYDQFISKINVELEENESELMSQLKTLHNLPQKIETSYFENNPRIFIRRIYDKYLWLLSQDRNERRNSLDIITQQKFWNYYES